MRRVAVPVVMGLVGLIVAAVLLRSPASRAGTAAAAGSASDARAHAASAPLVFDTERVRIRVVTLSNALVQPWAIAFLPDGDLLITERRGRLQRMHDGRLSEVSGVPPVDTRAQDGLMDLALHPRFAENRTIYFTYSKPGGDRGDTTALGSARLNGNALTDVREVFVADAWDTDGGNSGSRLVFAADGTIFMSVGDRHLQKPAQDLGSHMGKILRLNDDGRAPSDNPFAGRADARPEVYAYGVRNPQGLFLDAASGTLWEHEHGPRGGDELNVIRKGHNYGWPAITFGINYNGTIISKETAHAGMDQPIAHWVPSISPSGLTLYSGDRIPEWRGNIFMGALSGAHLRRLELTDGRVTHQEVLLEAGRERQRGDAWHGQRFRDVRQSPDGYLYVLTEGGLLFRIEKADSSPAATF